MDLTPPIPVHASPVILAKARIQGFPAWWRLAMATNLDSCLRRN